MKKITIIPEGMVRVKSLKALEGLPLRATFDDERHIIVICTLPDQDTCRDKFRELI